MPSEVKVQEAVSSVCEPSGIPAEPAGSRLHRIGEVAEEVGVSLRAVRYYEEQGLLVPETRTAGGFRLYSDDQIERLSLIKQMKPLGFTIDETRALLQARDVLRDPCTDPSGRELATGKLREFAAVAAEPVRGAIGGAGPGERAGAPVAARGAVRRGFWPARVGSAILKAELRRRSPGERSAPEPASQSPDSRSTGACRPVPSLRHESHLTAMGQIRRVAKSCENLPFPADRSAARRRGARRAAGGRTPGAAPRRHGAPGKRPTRPVLDGPWGVSQWDVVNSPRSGREASSGALHVETPRGRARSASLANPPRARPRPTRASDRPRSRR